MTSRGRWFHTHDRAERSFVKHEPICPLHVNRRDQGRSASASNRDAFTSRHVTDGRSSCGCGATPDTSGAGSSADGEVSRGGPKAEGVIPYTSGTNPKTSSSDLTTVPLSPGAISSESSWSCSAGNTAGDASRRRFLSV